MHDEVTSIPTISLRMGPHTAELPLRPYVSPERRAVLDLVADITRQVDAALAVPDDPEAPVLPHAARIELARTYYTLGWDRLYALDKLQAAKRGYRDSLLSLLHEEDKTPTNPRGIIL